MSDCWKVSLYHSMPKLCPSKSHYIMKIENQIDHNENRSIYRMTLAWWRRKRPKCCQFYIKFWVKCFCFSWRKMMILQHSLKRDGNILVTGSWVPTLPTSKSMSKVLNAKFHLGEGAGLSSSNTNFFKKFHI